MFAESVNKKMEFRKMVMTVLHARQQKRHKEQTLDYVGEGKGGMIEEKSIEI